MEGEIPARFRGNWEGLSTTSRTVCKRFFFCLSFCCEAFLLRPGRVLRASISSSVSNSSFRIEPSLYPGLLQVNKISWHVEAPHKSLVKFKDRLLPTGKETVLFPLCGKTVDMPYLAQLG